MKGQLRALGPADFSIGTLLLLRVIIQNCRNGRLMALIRSMYVPSGKELR